MPGGSSYCAEVGWGWVSRSRVRSVWDLFRRPSYAEHRSNQTPSHTPKHEKGNERRIRDQGGAKARKKGVVKRNPNKRPKPE